jgi:Flp pilus assembly protein TadD
MEKTAIQESVEQLYAQGRLDEAIKLLSEAITKQESCSLWNDWGVVQIALAERAFRRALKLEPANGGTAANLAVLLYSQGRSVEAVPLLRQALGQAEGLPRAHLAALLAHCESAVSPPSASVATPG